MLQALEETDASLTDVCEGTRQAGASAGQRDVLRSKPRRSHARATKAASRISCTVLDAERTALAAEDQLAQSETQTATALLATYKALGGGFRPLTTAAR